MDPEFLWSLFMDTGAPELYLLYHKVIRGTSHVLENGRPGSAPDGL